MCIWMSKVHICTVNLIGTCIWIYQRDLKTTSNKVWFLRKSIYGLHQSGRLWYNKLDGELTDLGFEKIKGYNCVYRYDSNVIVLLYVDDIVVFSKNEEYEKLVIDLIGSSFD